jgi:ATP synthase protein I
LSPLARTYRAAEPWLSAVWQFTGSALFGVVVGYGLDRWWGTKPYALLIGGLLGSAVGFYAFIRSVTRLLDEQSRKSKSNGNEPKP